MPFSLAIPSLLEYNAAKETLSHKPFCICGKQDCAWLSTEFRKLRDVRGSFTRTPVETTEKKRGKLNRIRVHIAKGLSVSEIATKDKRCAKKIQPAQTRTSSKQSKTHGKFIAWHHFHPPLIKEVAYNKTRACYTAKDTVPKEKVTELLGRDSTDYTDADTFDKGNYFFVPNYPLAKAKEDLKKLKHETSLASEVADVVKRSASPRSASPKRPHEARKETAHSKRQKVVSWEEHVGLLAEKKKLEEALAKMIQQQNDLREANGEEVARSKAALGTPIDPKSHGVNRVSLTSDEYHKQFPNACSEFFRFDSWEYLKAFIERMFFIKYTPPNPKAPLSQFEQCLMALFFMEHQCNLQFIAQIYGYKDHSQISRIINAWVPEWGDLGEDLSILPFITADVIDELEPQSYIDLDLRKVGAIIDGKDFYTETVRKDRVISVAQQGNKLHKSSFRILTWSLPCGLSFEHTDAFLARASEKQLNRLWCSNGRLKNIPPGYLIMGDKGFDQTTGFYYNNNGVLHPAFLHGNVQFSEEQLGHNLRACQLRYTCETFYSNVTNCDRLYGFIRRNMFHHFQDICHWGHGRANMYLPLQAPTKHKEYFKFCARHKDNEERKKKRTNDF